ncbi:MAG: phosphonate metabolism transcriptional regulator PhnF [Planctomycetes bacterium]|nr:phosphonate metabolism transcriptional regulator PhnF [Planctomycetota bacterium]
MSLQQPLLATSEPIYRAISRRLEQEIRAAYRPGDQLPAEHELAERFSVNRHTVRRAVEILLDSGLLLRQRGRGTFVAQAPIDISIAPRTRLTETLESQGLIADCRVLKRQVLRAVGGVASRLELEEGDEVLWLETLRLADGIPLCLIGHFLPVARFPALLEYTSGSLHAFIEKSCGFTPRRKFSLVTAATAEPSDAAHLLMAPGQPVLRVKSVNIHPHTGLPVEYGLTRFRADLMQVRVEPNGQATPEDFQ